jgi:hypothetical protein
MARLALGGEILRQSEPDFHHAQRQLAALG